MPSFRRPQVAQLEAAAAAAAAASSAFSPPCLPSAAYETPSCTFVPRRIMPIVFRMPQAAQFEGALPPLCVAVEDSASGVGSASAAEMGLIVGYVGASHISEVSERRALRCALYQVPGIYLCEYLYPEFLFCFSFPSDLTSSHLRVLLAPPACLPACAPSQS